MAGGERVRDIAGLKQEGNYADALARMNVLELPHIAEAKRESDEDDGPERRRCGAKLLVSV